MATNDLERAVIEAARAFVQAAGYEGEAALVETVTALDAHLATQDPTVVERRWHEVAEGDELRGNDGKFYPVIRTLKVQRGRYEVIVQVGGQSKQLTRPGPDKKNPTAWVRRGPAGHAVDALTHVFSSGPNPTT
jgi:hypothetical protein